MTMRIGRTIIAILVSLSVATLPATVGYAASASSATEMSAAAATPDCEHHRHTAPADKTQKIADDYACMAACALHCFNFTTTVYSGIAFLSPASAALKPVRTSDNIASRMGSPPFRPPRA